MSDEEKQSSKASGIAGTIVNVVLVIAIVIAFICTYTAFVTKTGSGVPSILGWEPFAIQSDSMYPLFEKGDLIIDRQVTDVSELEAGDVITFWTIIDGEKVLNTHRIVEVDDGGTYIYFITKGDNNDSEDSMTVHESEVVGKYVTKIKALGTVLDFLQTGTGFFCVIVLPVFAFFVYYLVTFFRVLFEYQKEKNRLQFEQERAETAAGSTSEQKTITLTEEQLRALMEKAQISLEGVKPELKEEPDTGPEPQPVIKTDEVKETDDSNNAEQQ